MLNERVLSYEPTRFIINIAVDTIIKCAWNPDIFISFLISFSNILIRDLMWRKSDNLICSDVTRLGSKSQYPRVNQCDLMNVLVIGKWLLFVINPILSMANAIKNIQCIIFLSATDFNLQFMFIGVLKSYLLYLCLFAHSGVQHWLCCVFALVFFVLSTLCYQFLLIVHFWLF